MALQRNNFVIQVRRPTPPRHGRRLARTDVRLPAPAAGVGTIIRSVAGPIRIGGTCAGAGRGWCSAAARALLPVRLDSATIRRISMSKLRTLGASLLLAMAAFASPAQAQGRGEVAGQVTASENGEPLSGAQVRIQGTSQQAVTDAGGRYRIGAVSPGSHTVSVTLVGRSASSRTVTVAAGQTATVNFQLSASAVLLEGVVVNAVTGQQERRREAGTNTSNINVGDLNLGPITKVADVLTGRTTGVTLQGV
ncbi:MAG: carboxypeptidase-like regulatory domain-containing protein, partial [Gemmatimonadetes bacterium]|nr:carboxypeptidase-like regulatory domain-containing protein [Gemmatimonadota bacterium]